LDGIEVYHPGFTVKESRRLYKIALKYELLITGGSDWHGETRNGEFGSYFIPSEKVQPFIKAYFNTEL
jgi:hypothetical protein